jgi:nucleoside-diphosphate-sugar epimerase
MKIVVIGGTGLIGSKLVWTKPADEILDKVARRQATLDRITKSATHH